MSKRPIIVHSRLSYGSQIWRPRLIKDMLMLERIQHCATKYILNDYQSSYKCLLQLRLLPLAMQPELNDLMFLIRHLKSPDATKLFLFQGLFHFSEVIAHSMTQLKLEHIQYSLSKTNLTRHMYFNRLPRLWNSLLPINLNLPPYFFNPTSNISRAMVSF